MKRLFELRTDDGFTIQEILVVILVSSLLVSFGVSTFLFASKLFSTWHTKSEVHWLGTRTLQTITNDIAESKQIVGLSDSTLILAIKGGKQITYRYVRNQVWRNADLLASERDMKISVKVSPDSGVQSTDYYSSPLKIQVFTSSKGYEFSGMTSAAVLRSGRAEFNYRLQNEQ